MLKEMISYMRSQAQRERDVETEVLASTFNYIVDCGLENFSMRELCKATGMSIGSIYYWFDNKDELIICAAQYGLSKVVDEIFNYVFETIEELDAFFASCLSEVEKYLPQLRAIFRLFMSNSYGKNLRANGSVLTEVYSQYAQRMAQMLGSGVQEMEILIHIFISVITDYVVTGNREVTEISIAFLYTRFKSIASIIK
jgi:AcrR family transcriptional regulator